MKLGSRQLDRKAPPEVATPLQHAGVAGAGGAGFPAYAKWERLEETPFLMVNHLESEPNYFADEWLGRTYAEEFADFFASLLDSTFEVLDVTDTHVELAAERPDASVRAGSWTARR